MNFWILVAVTTTLISNTPMSELVISPYDITDVWYVNKIDIDKKYSALKDYQFVFTDEVVCSKFRGLYT